MKAGVLIRPIRETWKLMFESSVPVWLKLIPIFAVVYVLSPLDLVPDWLIGLGLLDDMAILFIALRMFLSLVPKERIMQPKKESVTDGDDPMMWDGVVEDGEIIDAPQS